MKNLAQYLSETGSIPFDEIDDREGRCHELRQLHVDGCGEHDMALARRDRGRALVERRFAQRSLSRATSGEERVLCHLYERFDAMLRASNRMTREPDPEGAIVHCEDERANDRLRRIILARGARTRLRDEAIWMKRRAYCPERC
jgi:hypothetical protein